MSGTHAIGRLQVDVAVADMAMAMALRPRIEDLAWRLMPPVIERVFEALDLAGMHLILPKLELDLGAARAERLEEDALAALGPALHGALAKALDAARSGPAAGAVLVTGPAFLLRQFETFLATGVLPLEPRSKAFDAAVRLEALAGQQPAALIAMLRRRAGDRHVLERLVIQAGEAGLTTLLRVMAAAAAPVILGLIADVIMARLTMPAGAVAAATEPVLRRLVWVTTLEFLLRDAGSQFNRRRYLDFLLRREAARAGIDLPALLQSLAAAVAVLRERMGLRSSLPAVLSELLAETGAPADLAEPPATGAAGDPFVAAGAGDLEPLARLVRRSAGQDAALRAIVERLDRALFAGLIAALEPQHAGEILALADDATRAGRSEPLRSALALDEPALERALWTSTLAFLLREAGSQFNRRRYLEFLLRRQAAQAGVGYATLLQLLAQTVERLRTRVGMRSVLSTVLADLLAERPAEPALADTIERFLRSGTPGAAGRALAGVDPGWLAERVRRLAADAPGRADSIAQRLSEWLLPDELVRCLAPGASAGEAEALLCLADQADGAAWRGVLAGLVAGGAVPAVMGVERATAERLDRRAAWWPIRWLPRRT